MISASELYFLSVRPCSRLVTALTLTCCIAAVPSYGQTPQRNVKNGIVVGQTKLFNYRSLQLMLRSVEETLASTRFLDSQGVASAVGRLQGATATISASGFSASLNPVPQVVTTKTDVTGDKPGTTLVQETTKAAITPNPPTLPEQSPQFKADQTFGVAAQDLLAEQTALTYQAINLRLLLDRALTDRFAITDDVSGPVPTYSGLRGLAVIGFQISIDPPKQYKNSVAEVEITLTQSSNAAPQTSAFIQSMTSPDMEQTLSLVSLMPQSKTYNVATITRNANSFGIGAVVQALSLGFSSSKAQETLFLVRDTDTVALERLPLRRGDSDSRGDLKTLRFGWQFRPVLGRKSVEPGIRQVYAVIALPNRQEVGFVGKVEAHTYWRPYDAKNGTLGEASDTSANQQSLVDLKVPNFNTQDELLRPKITGVRWSDAGNGLVLLEVQGENFLPDTTVQMGPVRLGQENAYSIQGESRLTFLVSAMAFTAVTGKLFGRDGAPQDILYPGANTLSPPGLRISKVEANVQDASTTRIEVEVASHEGNKPARLTQPLVNFGGKLIGLSDAPLTPTFANDIAGYDGTTAYETTKLSFVVPTSLVREARKLIVIDPLKGPAYVAVYEIAPRTEFSATRIGVLKANSNKTQLAITGTNFHSGEISVIVAGETYTAGIAPEKGRGAEFQFVDSTLLLLTLETKALKGVKQIAVKYTPPTKPDATNNRLLDGPLTVILPLTGHDPLPEPKVTKFDDVFVGDSRTINIEGVNFDGVEKVMFEKQELNAKPASDGKSMKLRITVEITKQKGSKELTFVLEDGQEFSFKVEVKEKPIP